MCFFRRKKPKEVLNTKYKIGEFIAFKDRHNELTHGYIYSFKKDEAGNIIYDIQIGGECPAIIHDIAEDKIMIIPK